MKNSPINLFTSTNDPSFYKKSLDPTRNDIEHICRFFSIGKLRHFEKERGINFSHANLFIFVKTARGQYAIKFYPMHAAGVITTEYAINRLLAGHHFPTPAMCAGLGGLPFFASNDLLVTCYSYIDGQHAWQHIKKRNTIRRINNAMLSLKNILSADAGHIACLKQKNLTQTIKALAQESRALASYDQKETIDASLLDAYRTYQRHQALFTRQRVHNNMTLTNFLIYKETAYILDLSHIQEDYALADLQKLVFSCLCFGIPATTIKTITKDYFTRHKMRPELYQVLNTLVKTSLIKEYIEKTKREKNADISQYPPDFVRTYMPNLSASKKYIIALLKKLRMDESG